MIFQPQIEPVPIGSEIESVKSDGAMPAHLVLVYHLGIPFPLGDQLAVIPFGDLRIPMSKEDVEAHARKLLEEAEKLPKTSPIIRASGMSDVEQAVKSFGQYGDDHGRTNT